MTVDTSGACASSPALIEALSRHHVEELPGRLVVAEAEQELRIQLVNAGGALVLDRKVSLSGADCPVALHSVALMVAASALGTLPERAALREATSRRDSSLFAIASATLSPATQTVPGLAAGVDWRWGERWGAQGEVSAESARHVALAPGSVRVQVFGASVAAHYALLSSSSWRLRALAGAGVVVEHAIAEGFTENRSATGWAPCALAGVRGDWNATAHLVLFFQAKGVVVPWREEWTIDNRGLAVALAPLRATLSLGAEWKIF